MFDNIVANNEVNFNDLEKKIFKFVCDLGCCILKTLLESYDNKIKENRDKKTFRHKGYKINSIKTVLGVVTYKRAVYEYTVNENTKNECKKSRIVSGCLLGRTRKVECYLYVCSVKD